MSNRLGRYETRPNGYRVYLPKPLPPDPPVEIDGDLWWQLAEAERALGRLDGVTETLPNPNLFVAMYVRKEAVLSNQIEGTRSSLVDVLEFEARAADPDQAQDVAEVVN